MRTLPKSLGVMLASALLALGLAGAASSQTRGVSWLGVYSQEITPELRDGLSYNGDGVLIQRIVPDSPADDAGLKRGDVIVRVADRDIGSPNELASVIRSFSPGRRVRIEFVRDGRHQTIETRLQARRDQDFDRVAPTPPTMPETPTPPTPPARPGMGWHSHDGDRDSKDGDREERDGEDRDGEGPESDRNGNGDDVIRDLRGIPGMGGMGRMQMLNRGRLGVRIESLNPDLASYFGSRDTRGALVIEIVDGSAAEKADLHPGDVITRVGDRRIENAEDLVSAIGGTESGEVTLGYIRHGQRETADIRLNASPHILRLREGPGASGTTRIFRTPNGVKRVQIREDLKDDAQLREEIQQLKKELEDLRREMKDSGSNDEPDEGR